MRRVLTRPAGVRCNVFFCNRRHRVIYRETILVILHLVHFNARARADYFNPRLEVHHSISSHETHTSTGSDSNIALASKWLSDCSAKHSTCHLFEEGQERWYPTRLLDVGKHGEESHNIGHRLPGRTLPDS